MKTFKKSKQYLIENYKKHTYILHININMLYEYLKEIHAANINRLFVKLNQVIYRNTYE